MEQASLFFPHNNFTSHLLQTLKDLLNEKEFTDVTLVGDDNIQLTAHKVILSAFSPILRNLLLSNPHPHPLLYMRGVSSIELSSLLQFMYFGETEISQNNFNTFQALAKDLEVKGLEVPDESLEDKTPASNSCSPLLSQNFENTNGAEDLLTDQIKDNNLFPDEQTITIVDEDEDLDNDKSFDIPKPIQVQLTPSQFICKDCGFVLNNEGALEVHKKSRHSSLQFSCYECEYSTSSESEMESHQQNTHEQSKLLSCNECDYITHHRGNLREHRLAKHEFVKFSCQDCTFQATYQGDLKKHRLAIHEGVRFKCSKCKYETTTNSNLRKHENAKHRELKYLCDQCEYKTSIRTHLEQHNALKHEGIRFPCDLCEYKATSKGNLKLHTGSKHEGASYGCDQCGYQTSWRGSLRKHQLAKHS